MPQPLSRPAIGTAFIELQSIDSTNNYALERVHAGLASHGDAFFAHEQVAGKGQRGKTWMAEKSSSLIMSTVVNPAPLLLTQQFQLSACAAVSVHEFFSRYAGDDTSIKWPNDLYWQDRKAGGMLIENVIGQLPVGSEQLTAGSHQPGVSERSTSSSQWLWAVIGTGININQAGFDTGLKNPVSLRQITGKQFDTVLLAKELCTVLDKYFRILTEQGFEEIYAAYNRHLYKRDQKVKFKKESRLFEAVVKSVSPSGTLVVQHAIEEELGWGEVEWVNV